MTKFNMDDDSQQLSSRRAFLGAAGAIAVAGAGSLVTATTAAAQQPAAPAILNGSVEGRRFKAWLKPHGGVPGEGPPLPPVFTLPKLQEIRLLPLGGRMVQLRVEASSPCYTSIGDFVQGAPPNFGEPFPRATGFGLQMGPFGPQRAPSPAYDITNHTLVGIVEAVGPLVKRVKPGDRVIVGVTSHCGQCYQCLNGSPEMCQFMAGAIEEQITPIATTEDGTPVIASLGIGGLSELSVAFEEYCFPVFTDLPSVELSMLGDQLASGLAAGISKMKIQAGSDVVVFGAGPVGLGAVQSARLCSAGQIIVVEPIKARRDMALKLGATAVLDPWVEGDGLVPKIHDMCRPPTDNRFAGGHPNAASGADYAVNCAGMDVVTPKVEKSPDPTGILPMQQAWASGRLGGHLCLLGAAFASVSFPAGEFGIVGGRTIWPGQQAGLQSARDLPRFVKLMERGLIDAKSLIEGVYPLDGAVEAAEEVAYRTKIATVVTPNA